MAKYRCVIAKYDKRINMVNEIEVARFDLDRATKWLNNINKPAMIYHPGAVELENPYFAMAENNFYKEEYKKVID
jgi:hypothetical protein